MSERGPEEEPNVDASPSFHQRLRDLYGEHASRLDPGIELQATEREAEEALPQPAAKPAAKHPKDESSSSREVQLDSATSRGLFSKLAGSNPASVRYEVGAEVGRGGMGTVMRVWDQDLRRTLAMKILTATPSRQGPIGEKDEERLSRFLEEAQITGQLDHPGIVPVHDMGIGSDGRLYFTMRLVRGRELKEVLDLAREGAEGWTLTRVIGLLLKVCEAMAFAHSKGVVHRDLKPSNIMVGRFGEVYVMDWGLARVSSSLKERPNVRSKSADPSTMSLVRTVRRDESHLDPESPLITLDGDVVGTPSFMALEQAQGKLDELGARSDVFSLGGVLYYMLTGRSPYVEPGERVSPHVILQRVLDGPPAPVAQFASDASAELVAICEKAMARMADDRYGSMLEVAEDLEAYLDGRVVKAYEGGAWAEFRKWTSRNAGMAIVLAASLLIVLASIVGFAIQKDAQVVALEIEEQETDAALIQAEVNLQRAVKSAAAAQDNLLLASKQEQEANRQAALAATEARASRRTSYIASLSAANFSLMLDQIKPAYGNLMRTEESLRGWEWEHMQQRVDGARRVFDLNLEGLILRLSVSEDGERMYAFNSRGSVITFDLNTGKQLSSAIVDAAGMNLTRVNRIQVDFSPAGDEVGFLRENRLRVLRAGEKSVVEISGEFMESMKGKKASSMEYGPNGRQVSIGFEDGDLVVLNLALRTARELDSEGGPIVRQAWSPEGDRLVVLSSGGALRTVDLSGGSATLTAQPLKLLGDGIPTEVQWSGDGQRLVTARGDGAIELWDTDGRLIRNLARHEGSVTVLTTEGDRFAVGYDDGLLLLGSLAGDEPVRLRGHQANVMEILFTGVGRSLVSCDVSGSVRIWDVLGDGATTTITTDVKRCTAAAMLANKGAVALSGPDGFIGLYGIDSGARLRIFRGHDEQKVVGALAVSADERFLLSGSGDRTARLWDVSTGEPLAVFKGHTKMVVAVALSSSGKRAYTTSLDSTIRVWNCRTGEQLQKMGKLRGRPHQIMLDEARNCLIVCSRGISIWDLATGSCIEEIESHGKSPTRTIALSPDGSKLVSSSSRGDLAFWDLASRDAIEDRSVPMEDSSRIPKGGGMINAISFLSDSERLLTSSSGGGIDVRDPSTGEPILRLSTGKENILCLGFRPSLGAVTGVGFNGAIRTWYTTGRVKRLDERRTAAERRMVTDRILRESLEQCPRLDDLPLMVQERADLAGDQRSQILAEAEWIICFPDFADQYHQDALLQRDLSTEGFQRLAGRARAMTERWANDVRLSLTLVGSLVRTQEFADASTTLKQLEWLNEDTKESNKARESARLSESEEQAMRLLGVLVQHGLGEFEAAKAEWETLDRELSADLSLGSEEALAKLAAEVRATVTGL